MNFTDSERIELCLHGSVDGFRHCYWLGFDQGSKSKIYRYNLGKNFKYEKLYDFQHSRKYFDDFKQNLVLRILDGRIQIFHDQKGWSYFPSEYVRDDKIRKASITSLVAYSLFDGTIDNNSTIQRVQIESGYF